MIRFFQYFRLLLLEGNRFRKYCPLGLERNHPGVDWDSPHPSSH